jgi:heptosyltransferase I
MGEQIAAAARSPAASIKSARTPCRAARAHVRSQVLLSPDSGPAHMATMVGLPVIGLYAATNPPRAGPYYSRAWCVDKYDAGRAQVSRQTGRADSLDHQDRAPGVMDLIEVSDVRAKLDALMAARVFR